MSSDIASPDLAGAIDVIEETYEYMLAYAAQGRVDDTDTSSAGIRAYLERSDQALGVIASAELAGDAARKFLEVMRQDAARASAAIATGAGQTCHHVPDDRQSECLGPCARLC